MSKENTQAGGISFAGILTIVFIVLKLTNYIDWSWWWILSPIWLPLAVIAIIAIFLIIVSRLS